MYIDAEDLVHEIYCRHLRSLTIANSASMSVPVATVRLVLHLALSELADRMAPPQPAEPQPEQPIAVASANFAATVQDVPAANVTVDSDSEPQPKKRMGRPPKAKPEHRSERQPEPQPVTSQYNIAVAAPAAIGIDPDLVTSGDDEPITMNGILRRQETVTKRVNGVPTAVTREYIELR